jgi:hypothetical protein
MSKKKKILKDKRETDKKKNFNLFFIQILTIKINNLTDDNATLPANLTHTLLTE